MTHEDRVAELKEQIKQLAEEQTKDKARLRQPHDFSCHNLQAKCHARAAKITAYLNFYHINRFKEHRHSTSKFGYWLLKTIRRAFDADFPTLFTKEPEPVLIQESQVESDA